jgi:hypothetical protein
MEVWGAVPAFPVARIITTERLTPVPQVQVKEVGSLAPAIFQKYEVPKLLVSELTAVQP